MKIIALEYASAGLGTVSDSILGEGFAMLRSLTAGLCNEHEVVAFLNPKLKKYNPRIDCKILYTVDFFKEIEEFKDHVVFPIAPDYELYRIVKHLRQKKFEVLASDTDAIKIASDKLLLHKKLTRKKIRMPETFLPGKINFEFPVVVKPRFGAGCENVFLVKNKRELIKLKIGGESIVQEFIPGIHASITLISNGKKAVPVTLNKQEIKLSPKNSKYLGGQVPFEHPLKKEAFKLAKSAVESISGLRGPLGVDIILANEPYVIEINPRFTTSMIAFDRLNFNFPLHSLNSFHGKLPEIPKFRKTVKITKTAGRNPLESVRLEWM